MGPGYLCIIQKKKDMAVENFKEGARKAAGLRDGLGLEMLKTAEKGE